MGLQPTGPTRVNLEVIVPSSTGLTPAKWKQTATLCPLDWPSNYSLLRLWHMTKSFHQYAAQLKQQIQHRHMFTHWEVNSAKLASIGCSSSDQPIMCQKRSLGNMYKNGSSLIGDYVGEHQQLTGLPFRPNATSYGSLPQGQRGLTLSPSRLGTAGMTPSEQINNTTLNILHGVRRSDPPPPPPLPSVLLCFAFVFCALVLGRHIAFCSHLLLCCGGPFVCLRGVLSPRGPPFTIWQFFWCGFDSGRALLPSFVLGLVFLLPFVRGLSVFVVLSFWCFCLRVCWCLSVVVVLLFVCGWAPLPSVSVLFVWLLSAPFPAGRCFPSPCGWSLVAPWPSLYAGPSLWVSGCFRDGLVALP